MRMLCVQNGAPDSHLELHIWGPHIAHRKYTWRGPSALKFWGAKKRFKTNAQPPHMSSRCGRNAFISMALSRRCMFCRKVVGFFHTIASQLWLKGDWQSNSNYWCHQTTAKWCWLVISCLSICGLCFQHLSGLGLDFRSRQLHSSFLLWVIVASASESWGPHITLFASFTSKGSLKIAPAGRYIYIYMLAVELLSGPSLAFWGVIIWSKFVKKNCLSKTL